jgi:hypothetical protein
MLDLLSRISVEIALLTDLSLKKKDKKRCDVGEF